MKANPKIFFAGQITGVEGYVESASSGILAGYNMAMLLTGREMLEPSPKTCIGALVLYISDTGIERLQPMNANFGIIEGWHERVRGPKTERYRLIAERSLALLKDYLTGDTDI
jgi:methylenetetrahydrofolate--tRNA-(uracil-5-)-methyltransferase